MARFMTERQKFGGMEAQPPIVVMAIEFYSILEETGGDCSDDEEDAIDLDDNDEVIDD